MDYRVFFLAPLAALVLSVGAAAPLRMPSDWYAQTPVVFSELKRSFSNTYDVGIDPASDATGTPNLTVRFVAPPHPGIVSMGAAHQSTYGYAGKRLRLSGQVRADAVKGWAGLYLGQGDGTLLSRIAMARPGIEALLPAGTAVVADGGWHDVSVVFDVPAEAVETNFGLALVGEGQVWARNLRFQVVGAEIPTTATTIGVDLQSARRFQAEAMAEMAKRPPEPLVNPALD